MKYFANLEMHPLHRSAIWRRCRQAARVQLAELRGEPFPVETAVVPKDSPETTKDDPPIRDRD